MRSSNELWHPQKEFFISSVITWLTQTIFYVNNYDVSRVEKESLWLSPQSISILGVMVNDHD